MQRRRISIKRLALLLVLLSAVFGIAQAEQVVIGGTIVQSDGTPLEKEVFIFQKGAPYFPTNFGDTWAYLGRGRSDINGRYSIGFEREFVDDIAVYVPFRPPQYALVKLVNIEEQDVINGVRLSMPVKSTKPRLSVRFRYFEKDREIAYDKRIFSVSISPAGLKEGRQGVMLYLTNSDYSITKNKVFDMPDGEYRVVCILASVDVGSGEFAKEFQVTMPLTDKTIVVDFSEVEE